MEDFGFTDDDGVIDAFHVTRTLHMLREAHKAFHTMPTPTAESDTLLMSLAERDLLLIGMALPAMELLFLQSGVACFTEASKELQNRFMEVVQAQRPEWVVGYTPEDSVENDG